MQSNISKNKYTSVTMNFRTESYKVLGNQMTFRKKWQYTWIILGLITRNLLSTCNYLFLLKKEVRFRAEDRICKQGVFKWETCFSDK